jgi:hypothetical protein
MDGDDDRLGAPAAERAPEEQHPETADRGGLQGGMPPIAEALGYIGGALALAAVAALLFTFWSTLGPVGHFGIGAALAVAGLAGGFAIGRNKGAAAQRLSHFLLLAGVVGVGVAVGFAVRDALHTYLPRSPSVGVASADAAEWGWFAGALAVALSGGLVWWRHRTVLQHLAFGLGVAAAALLALPLIPVEGPEWGVGATLIAVGVVWGALSLWDRLPPSTVGLVLAALGIFGGIEMMVLMTEPTAVWAMWLGAVACAGLIWAGSRLEELGVLGIGTVGLMALSGQLVGEYLGFGAGTAIALIAIGFALLGIGVRLTLRRTAETSQDRGVASEVAGYLGIALAMGGAGILMVQSWDELGVIGRIMVPLVGTGVAYYSALALERSESGTARRLSQTLLAIGVLSAGITAAMVAQPVAENVFGPSTNGSEPSTDWTVLAGAVSATLIGGVTWLLRKGSLTQVAFMGGAVMSVIAALNFRGPDSSLPFWAFGLLLVALGTVWVALGAAERVVPVRTALATGSVVTLWGLQMMAGGDDGFVVWAALVGIAYGVAAIAASIYLKRAILLGFGAVGVILFSTATVMEVFGDRMGAPILLLVMGVVFIAVAVVIAKVAPRIRREPKTTDVPKAPLTQA